MHILKTPVDSLDQPGLKTDCFLFGGASVMQGTGIAVVCAVGPNSMQGKLQQLIMVEDETKTPLQAKLSEIGDQIGKVGLYAAILTVLALISNLVIAKIINEEPVLTVATFSSIVRIFLIGITIVVVAVPEGLPLAVTISLAYSVMKMKDQYNLVRRLDASETMGGANQICSDKTGTLTQNIMTVMTIYVEGKEVDSLKDMKENTKKLFLEGVCVNSSANIIYSEEKKWIL